MREEREPKEGKAGRTGLATVLVAVMLMVGACDPALRTIERIAEIDPLATIEPQPAPLTGDLQAPGRPSEQVRHLLSGVEKGQVEGNVEKLERLARAGDGTAFIALGRILREGRHRQRDTVRACRMFELAIELGRPEGLLELGRCFLRGAGRPQNYEQAATLFSRASEKNVTDAHCHYGVMLADGLGVRSDPRRAMQLCAKGYVQGDLRARAYVGYWTAIGHGIEKQPEQGIRILRNAIIWGGSEAAALLGMLLLGGFEDIAPNIQEATKMLRRSARHGNALGAFLYGVAQDAGYNEYVRDPIAVREWWLIAARGGITQAYAHLGSMHFENAVGLATPDPDRKRHVEEGLFWLSLAVRSVRRDAVLLGLNMRDVERMRERLETALNKVDEGATGRILQRVDAWLAGRRDTIS